MVYFLRYYDVNKKKIVPLQLKINNFSFGNLYMFTSDTTLVPIFSDGNKFFRKYREIWNKIIELIGINIPPKDFVETTLNDDEDEFIMLDVEKNTKTIEINIDMILYLFLHLFLIMYFKYH